MAGARAAVITGAAIAAQGATRSCCTRRHKDQLHEEPMQTPKPSTIHHEYIYIYLLYA